MNGAKTTPQSPTLRTHFVERRRSFQGISFCKHCAEKTIHDVSGTKAKCHQCGKGGRMKFNSTRSEYNGRWYDSGAEAQYAAELDLRVKAKEIISWEPQKRFTLMVNGRLVGHHKVDFQLLMPDGTVELHEVKGLASDDWKLRRNVLLATVVDQDPNISYKVIQV